MRSRLIFAFLCVSAARTAFALTCGGFSIVTADHVVVKYSAPVATGATRSAPFVSMNGTDITVALTLSGGSATDVSCVDDTIDLGYLSAGRFNLTWSDSIGFTTQQASFTFFVGQPGGSTDGASGNVWALPPLLTQQPVRLAVFACSEAAPAVAYVTGNDIHVSKYYPPTGPACLSSSVMDLGILPSGTYNVTASLLNQYGPITSSFAFVVQQPAATSACSGAINVTRTQSGTVRLHFEDSYRGYAPAFGFPSVTSIAGMDDSGINRITIYQPVADTANSGAYGAPRPSALCHAEEVDLGPLADGYHEISWIYQVSVNGVRAGTQGAGASFYLQNGKVQCTSNPEFLTLSPAIEGVPFEVAMKTLTTNWQYGQSVTVYGQTITVVVNTEGPIGPGVFVPSCVTYTAPVNPLPAGEYTVVWLLTGGGGEVFTSLTVAKSSRQRAARH